MIRHRPILHTKWGLEKCTPYQGMCQDPVWALEVDLREHHVEVVETHQNLQAGMCDMQFLVYQQKVHSMIILLQERREGAA